MGPEIGTCIGIDASVVWMSSSTFVFRSEKVRVIRVKQQWIRRN
jgi:hypothetical protein